MLVVACGFPSFCVVFFLVDTQGNKGKARLFIVYNQDPKDLGDVGQYERIPLMIEGIGKWVPYELVHLIFLHVEHYSHALLIVFIMENSLNKGVCHVYPKITKHKQLM
jgi:hypothetical protein